MGRTSQLAKNKLAKVEPHRGGFVAALAFSVAVGLCVSVDSACAANSTDASASNATSSTAATSSSSPDQNHANLQKKRAAASLLSAPMQATEDHISDDVEGNETGRGESTRGEYGKREIAGSNNTRHYGRGSHARGSQVPAVAPSIESRHTRARRFLKEGARLHRIGEYADAERLFRESVALDPRNADAFFNLGALAEGRGDFVDALGQYRAALNIQPNDKSLKDAVESMEVRLAAGQGVHASPSDSDRMAGFKYPPRMLSNPNPVATFSEPPLLEATTPDNPTLAAYNDPAPVLPASNNGPFQLQSTQNTSLMPTGYTGPNFGALNANSLPRVPTLTVNQPSRNRRVAGATLNAAMRFGMRAALSGTGLHCPACHWLRF